MSKYYSSDDFACHCGCGFCEVNPILEEKLDALVERLGTVPDLNCAARCEEHNLEVGGVPTSQHTKGNAADIDCPEDISVDELAEIAAEVGFDGIGTYPSSNFVHVDVRSDGEEPATYLWDEDD